MESIYKASVGTFPPPLSRKCCFVGNWCKLEARCQSLPFSILIGWLSYNVLVVATNEEHVPGKISYEHINR